MHCVVSARAIRANTLMPPADLVSPLIFLPCLPVPPLGRRLLYAPGLLWRPKQRLLLTLLGDWDDPGSLPELVEELGGLEFLFLRFFEHYEVGRGHSCAPQMLMGSWLCPCLCW